MTTMDKRENVIKQYADGTNLSIRTSLHAKYSTNKLGLAAWLFEQYQFADGYQILELGCGNGGQWEGRLESLPAHCHLILSDFSQGMVEAAKAKYGDSPHVFFAQADIQSLGYQDESFDVVIANHMLYHVPELSKALSEVSRVLKKGGTFYASTNGSGGMQSFLRDAIRHIAPDSTAFAQTFSFTLQNGASLLKEHFSKVSRLDYEDSLSITQTQDLMDWLRSTTAISAFDEKDSDGAFEYFEALRKKDGAINIPKECGLFVCAR